jgi:hypothetical protein
MQFVKGKPPEAQHATRPGAHAKRPEVALGRPGFELVRLHTWLSLRPSQGQAVVSLRGRTRNCTTASWRYTLAMYVALLRGLREGGVGGFTEVLHICAWCG